MRSWFYKAAVTSLGIGGMVLQDMQGLQRLASDEYSSEIE